MEPKIDLTKEYGIVLEGGGAKGAYQIGVWKALKEAGVKICAVAGTSVGALNGALICMGDLEKAECLWNEICYSKVMDVNDDLMERLFNGELSLQETLKRTFKFLGDKGADITPLKKLIAENIKEDYIRKSPVEFYLLTFSLSDLKELDIDVKESQEGLLGDLLLASAYLPVFKSERLHGKKYIDGGMINNVPLESLVSRDYKNIITVRIFGPGREKKVKIPEDVTIINIEPRVNLGNMLEFNKIKSKRNIKIGYYDGLRAIYGLEGKIYYIEQTHEECYYLKQIISLDQGVKLALAELHELDTKEELLNRNLFETILPAIALELKLEREWSYTELYLAMLEATAKLARVQKYEIYTPDILLERIRGKRNYLNEFYGNKDFVMVILGT